MVQNPIQNHCSNNMITENLTPFNVYEWLVVAGLKAMYKGTGTINGAGNYGFILSAIDEALTPSTDVDLFRIKIWDKENEAIIYDNQIGEADDADLITGIMGGSIVIHKE